MTVSTKKCCVTFAGIVYTLSAFPAIVKDLTIIDY